MRARAVGATCCVLAAAPCEQHGRMFDTSVTVEIVYDVPFTVIFNVEHHAHQCTPIHTRINKVFPAAITQNEICNTVIHVSSSLSNTSASYFRTSRNTFIHIYIRSTFCMPAHNLVHQTTTGRYEYLQEIIMQVDTPLHKLLKTNRQLQVGTVCVANL